MFHWLKRKGEKANRRHGEQLFEAVRAALPDADDMHLRIVGATAALLLCVAYADHEYAPEEETRLRETLSAIEGLDREGVEAIVGVLREQVVHIVAAEASSYARELLELTAHDFRLQLLDLLVDVAAADGVVTVAETNTVRVAAKALGLTGAQYNASQARHRDKLAVLRS